MPLTAGHRIGQYEILGSLGAGGMGEVYRAKDSKLKREVAIKVLPAEVANDRERLARFQREAEVLASLNHPNIAHVYGIEEHALVMELVEGEDLSQRLARGPIPLDEALPIATQIAEALEAAHDAGIIHRDLKPGNIKVRDDGTVKVLDFGLAKALQDHKTSGPHDLADSPTITSPAMMTMRGVILGTAAYMSPEQAKGRPVDKRADIWAFGCVLFEMLSGKKTFTGEDVTDTITSLMRDAPDWQALPTATPPTIRTLLRRCLEKDAKRRPPHIGIARMEIEDAMTKTGELLAIALPAAAPARWRRVSMAIGGVLLALSAAGVGYLLASPGAAPAENVYRSSLLVTQNLYVRAPTFRFALSPDGRRLAYAAAAGANLRDGRTSIWIRTLTGTDATSLVGSDDASAPFWSPDSRGVAFFAGGQLKRADVSGGPAIRICDVASSNQSGSWSSEGVIVFRNERVIARVNAGGGQPQDITELDASAGETSHNYPFFLPDGKRFLFTAFRGLVPVATYAGSIDGGKPTRLMDGGSNAQYARGMVLFMPAADRGYTETSLMARPFDADRLAFTGEPVLIAERVLPNLTTFLGGAFTVSPAGTLVYQSAASLAGMRLVWSTRSGQQTPVITDTTNYRSLELSHDGTRVVLTPMDAGGRADVWIYALDRGTRTRLTFDGRAIGAVWSPDDRSIVFAKFGGGNAPGQLPVGATVTDLFRKRLDGGDDELVFADASAKLPLSFSRDGRVLVFDRFDPPTLNDIWKLPLDGSGKASPMAATRFWERWGQISPNGRWLAYATAESSASDVVVIRLDGAPGRWQVSAGGNYPRWSHDGRELFFHTPDNKIAATRITETNGGISFGPVVPLFDARAADGFGRFFYDVAPDGRFLLSAAANTNLSTELTFITNWPGLVAR